MVVNGFWHDSELGKLEKLCIDSIVKCVSFSTELNVLAVRIEQ